MTKSEQKKIAKDVLMEAIACAYYKLEEMEELGEITEDDSEVICEYIHKYGNAMATRIGETFYTL